MVYHGVEDDDDGQCGVVSREGHPATELALVYHVHVGSKKRDFGHTIKRDFQQKKCLAGCCQRVPLCPISRKKTSLLSFFVGKLKSFQSVVFYLILLKAIENETKLITIENSFHVNNSSHLKPCVVKARIIVGS